MNRTTKGRAVTIYRRQRFGDVSLDIDLFTLEQTAALGKGIFDNIGDICLNKVVLLASRVRSGKIEYLLDHSCQLFTFALNELTVSRDLTFFLCNTVGQVLAGGIYNGKRCAKFMRNAGHKINLPLCEHF